MRIFISGGCKNGKSLHAQRLVKNMPPPLYYLATMRPKDSEDDERVQAHRQAREGWGFQTIEAPENILAAVRECDCGGAFLLDSVTALLENAMFRDDGTIIADAWQHVADDLLAVVASIRNIVIVSDAIEADAEAYPETVEQYRRGLAQIDRALARVCDTVAEACCGELVVYKGQLPLLMPQNEMDKE